MSSASRMLVLFLCAAGCGARQPEAAAPPRTRTPAAPAASAKRAPAPAPAEASRQAGDTGEAPVTPPGGQQSAYAPTSSDQVFVRRMLDVIDQVAAVIDRQQNDCGRMASDLEGIFRRNQDLIFMAKQMKGDAAREKWIQEQAMERLQKAIPRMMTGFQKCQNDASMQALMRQLGT